MVALTWVLFVISLIIVVISFIMSPDASSFSGALVGSSDLELFKSSKEKGSKKILKNIMFACGILLLILSVVVRVVM